MKMKRVGRNVWNARTFKTPAVAKGAWVASPVPFMTFKIYLETIISGTVTNNLNIFYLFCVNRLKAGIETFLRFCSEHKEYQCSEYIFFINECPTS